MTVPQSNPKANRLNTVHAKAQHLATVYGLPYRLAFKVAQQQTPRTGQEDSQNANQWLVCEVVYFAKKYNTEITRTCHLLPQQYKGYLNTFDIQRNEKRGPIANNVRKIRLFTMSEMVALVDAHEYVEKIVLGKTREQADRDYTARHEANTSTNGGLGYQQEKEYFDHLHVNY